MQTCLFSPSSSSSKSSKTTDILRQTKVAHRQVGMQAKCYQGQQYHCLQNIRDQALSLWSGSTDSKALDYQRTNPRKYQIVRTHTKEPLEYKTQHHPNTSSTLCRMPHLNNKQNKNKNLIISRQDSHLTQPCPSEEKQTNRQTLSTNFTLYEAYTNHWTNLRNAEIKGKK